MCAGLEVGILDDAGKQLPERHRHPFEIRLACLQAGEGEHVGQQRFQTISLALDAVQGRPRIALAPGQLQGWRVDRRALRDALRNGADPAAIKPLADKAGQHVAEMIVMRAETRAKISAA